MAEVVRDPRGAHAVLQVRSCGIWETPNWRNAFGCQSCGSLWFSDGGTTAGSRHMGRIMWVVLAQVSVESVLGGAHLQHHVLCRCAAEHPRKLGLLSPIGRSHLAIHYEGQQEHALRISIPRERLGVSDAISAGEGLERASRTPDHYCIAPGAPQGAL